MLVHIGRSSGLANGTVYYDKKLPDGTYADGTWRRVQVGDNLEDQIKIGGIWKLAQRRERPIG